MVVEPEVASPVEGLFIELAEILFCGTWDAEQAEEH
jgi:hypothetical protein